MGKLFFLGPDSPVKQILREELQRKECSAAGKARNYVCAEQTDGMTAEDSAMIFGNYDPESGAEDQRWFDDLAGAVELVRQIRPRRALFVSDTMIYGKLFGKQHLVREDEIGYVCHTAAGDMTAQWMRMAEHLCARLAREEGASVKLVRADWRQIQEKTQAAERRGTILDSMLGILENGTAGEAYNLSVPAAQTGTERNEACERQRSPLAPITVIPDTGKAEKYVAS